MLGPPSEKHSMWTVTITTDKFNEQESLFLSRATSEAAHCLCWVWRPQLTSRASRRLWSLCSTIDGEKIERTAFLKCQTVGVLAEISHFSLSLSILIDKAAFDNAPCCHHDIWSPFLFASPASQLNRNITMGFNTGSIAALQWYIHSNNEYWWMKTNNCTGNLYSRQSIYNSHAYDVSLWLFRLCVCFLFIHTIKKKNKVMI